MTATGNDRRDFLRKAGLGAVAAGAWVAPQVLSTATASAACTPITKLLQIQANACPGNSGVVTTSNACAPLGWSAGVNDGVTFTCSSLTVNPAQGSTITITNGCTPTSARAVKYCPTGSGTGLTCVTGTIVGTQITFTMNGTDILNNCVFVDFRITVSCCT